MPTFEIICLVKSIKHGGSCIAGIKTDGSGWLRPISNKRDGTLYPEHYTIKDGREPQIFDMIRIPCLKPEPKYHQPENWVIDYSKKWQILGNATLQQAQKLLNPEIDKYSSTAELLGSLDKLISYEELQKVPIKSSLALIKPDELQWQIKKNYQNKITFRCLFSLCGNFYDLPITDPVWLGKLHTFEVGIYSCDEVIEKLGLENFAPDKFRLTISLGEPFQPSEEEQEFCYKLVAAVINITDIKQRFGWI